MNRMHNPAHPGAVLREVPEKCQSQTLPPH